MSVVPGRILALTKKELYSQLNSPVFYGIAVFFLLFTSVSFFYFQQFFARNVASLRPYFSAFPLAFVMVIPVITMKSWAEERKLGSAEILLTMPFSEWDLTLGKYFASLTMVACLLVLTLPLPLSLLPLGNFDGAVIATEYLGALLLGMSAAALGHLLSALSKNQAGAFLGTMAALLLVMLMNQFTLGLGLSPLLSAMINAVSLAFHFESFAKGLVDTRDLAYFLLTTVLFLYLNTRVLLFRRWS